PLRTVVVMDVVLEGEPVGRVRYHRVGMEQRQYLPTIPAVERDPGLLVKEIVAETHSLTALRYRRSIFEPSFIAGGSRTGSTSVGTRCGSGLDPACLYCCPALAATWLAMWGAPNSPNVLARAWGTARVGTTLSGPQRAVASRARS